MYVTHAGSMLSTLYGMLGLTHVSDTKVAAALGNRSLSLPEGWDKVAIEQVWLGGLPYRASGVHGGRLELQPLSGEDTPSDL